MTRTKNTTDIETQHTASTFTSHRPDRCPRILVGRIRDPLHYTPPPLQQLPPPFPTVSVPVSADGIMGYWRVPENGAAHIGAARALIRDHAARLRCTKNANAFYAIMEGYRYA